MNRTIERCARTAAFCGVLIGAMAPAYAQNPHFVKADATLNRTTGAFELCFKEAGLGSSQTVDYVATGNATATYVCRNRGGQCPNAANKTTVVGPVQASGTFTATKSGQITACLTVNPPPPGGFNCPGGQTLVLSSVSYTNVAVTDVTNNVTSTSFSDSLDRGECPRR